MIYLIYTSVANHAMSDAELVELLGQSKTHNLRDGITGLLLYREGLFMQLLEGPEEAVLNCYARICADARHSDIIKLLERPSRQRLFGDWAMAFQNVEQMREDQGGGKDYEGFSPFLNQPLSPEELGHYFNEGMFLLLSFKKGTSLQELKIRQSIQ